MNSFWVLVSYLLASVIPFVGLGDERSVLELAREEMATSEVSVKGYNDTNVCNSGPEKANSGAGKGKL